VSYALQLKSGIVGFPYSGHFAVLSPRRRLIFRAPMPSVFTLYFSFFFPFLTCFKISTGGFSLLSFQNFGLLHSRVPFYRIHVLFFAATALHVLVSSPSCSATLCTVFSVRFCLPCQSFFLVALKNDLTFPPVPFWIGGNLRVF